MENAVAIVGEKPKALIQKEDLIRKIEEEIAKEEINAELVEIEDFYKTLKKQVLEEMNGSGDAKAPARLGMKQPSAARKSMYLSSQTSNMISLKQLKFQMIKEKNRIDEVKIDKKIKLLQLISDEGGNKEEISAQDILDYLVNHVKSPASITGEVIDMEDMVEQEMYDDELDKRLDEALEEETNSVEEDPKLSVKYEETIFDKYYIDGENIKFIYDTLEDKVYLVDGEYNILEEVDEDSIKLEIDEIDPDNTFLKEMVSGTIVEEVGDE